MAPVEVTKENEKQVILNIRARQKPLERMQKPLKTGEIVRITRAKSQFEKGAISNFTQEIFKIKSVNKTPQRNIYHPENLDREDLTSIYYHDEFKPAKIPFLYKIEKILSKRKNPKDKKIEYLVKFVGYPNKFNSSVENVESI